MKWWLIVLMSLLLAIAVALPVAQTQPLTVVQGQLQNVQGIPVAYQPILIEAKSAPSAWYFFWSKKATVKALTDENGTFQVIDLPPGKEYVVKTLKAGAVPTILGTFETPYGYRKIDVSDKLKRIMGEVESAPLPRPQ